MRARFAALLLWGVASGALAAMPPSGMMANVYRLTEAGAALELCFQSAEYKALPAEKVREFRGLSSRLGEIVRSIGRHYGDPSLFETYESTKARISADSKLKLHMKNHYGYCGERLAREMETYVSENEKLIGEYFGKASRAR